MTKLGFDSDSTGLDGMDGRAGVTGKDLCVCVCVCVRVKDQVSKIPRFRGEVGGNRKQHE